MAQKQNPKVRLQTKPEVQALEAVVAVAETVASDAVVVKRYQTRVDADGVVKYKCQFCGKWIVKDENISAESGDYCRHLRGELGMDDAALAAHRASMTRPSVPEGWVKVAQVDRRCKKEGIPISALVKAFGGDRCIDPPLRPEFQIVYVGNARWMDGWTLGDDSMKFLKSVSREGKKSKTQDALEVALSQ
jgi:hypothetical protein